MQQGPPQDQMRETPEPPNPATLLSLIYKARAGNGLLHTEPGAGINLTWNKA